MKKPARRPPAKAAKITDVTRSVANAPVMIFEIDAGGTITLLAGGLAEHLGLKPAQAIGRKVLDMHPGNARAAELLGRALSGEEFCAVIHIRGRLLEMCFTPRRDKAGKPAGMTGWATDITERRQAEEQYQAVFKGAHEGILVADASRRFKYANPAVCALLGYSEQELLRMRVDDIHPKAALPRVIADFEALTKGKKALAPEIPCLRKDGAVIFADVTACPIESEDAPLFAGFFTDVTEKKIQERAMRLAQFAMDNAAEGILCNDAEGRLTYANATICRQLGYSQDELLALRLWDIAPGFTPKSLRTRWAELGEGATDQFISTQRRKDGSPVPVEVTVSHIRFEGEKLAISFVRDISDREEAAAALQRSEQRYRAIFDGAAEGILVADSTSRKFLYANPAICGLLGYTTEELCRLGVDDIHPPEDLPRIIEKFEAQTRGEALTAADCPCRRRDGTVVYADIKSGPALIDGRACTVGFFTDATERRRGEAAQTLIGQRLKNSLRFTEALLSAIPTPVFYKDREGRYLGCNRAFSELMGVTPERIKGKTVHELWPSEHAKVYHEKDLEVMRHPARQVYEFKVRDKDGRDRQVIYAKDVFRDENDQVAGLVGAFLDISERKQAEAALIERNDFTESLLESMHDGLCVLDPRGRRLMANASLARMTGYSKEELLAQKPPYPFWPPEHRDRIQAAFQAILRGEAREQELVYMRKDGERFPVLLSPVCRRDEKGGTQDIILTIKDISALREADEGRQLSLSLLQATLESTADGILVVDTEGKVSSHNQRFLSMWEIPDDLAARKDDRRLLDFVQDKLLHPAQFLAKVRELYSKPGSESFDTLEFKDGRVFERYSHPQRLNDRIAGRVWSFRDVTQRVRAEIENTHLLERERAARAEAEAADKAKDDFLAIVSHELRTPLTAVMGWSWLLRSGKLAEDERQNALDIILRNMQSQRQIVEDLIDVSSLSRGMFALNRKPVDLKTLLTTDCEALQQLANSRGIRLIQTLGAAPVGVLADAGRLQQVCRNLLHNALKFTPDAGEVRVSLRQEGGQAVIEVQDSGKGIPPEFLPQLFQPFRQGEDPLTREHGGLGLGLSIVKRLVELHGGTVSAASAGQGQGSVFTVRLPAIPWPPPGAPQEPEPADRRGSLALDGLKILVVEDEEDGRLMLEQLLRRYGAVVASAADAAEALQRLEADVPDLLLCDIAMPGEDGCSLLRKVRSRGGKLGSVPAAAITALAKEDDRLRAMQAGFQIYLTKPADPAQILEAVRSLVPRR